MLDIKTVKLRTEEEIIASWIDKKSIVVSVICATYNHELYIEDAITGFLMQETNFSFEIIIHDDASTDKTASIIKRYQEQYPNIIKPIYQTENQYSKGSFKPGLYMAKFAKGEFLAWCEGDDYWINSQKIQLQADFLLKNKGVSLCFHSAIEKNILLNSSQVICNHGDENKFIFFKSVVHGRGGYIPTASIFLRRFDFSYFESVIKDYVIGDFFLQTYSASLGKVYFFSQPMCVYRRNSVGSWTSQQLSLVNNEYSLNMVKNIDHFFGVISLEKKEYLYETTCFYIMQCLYQHDGRLNKLKSLLTLLSKDISKMKKSKLFALILFKAINKKLRSSN